MCDMTPYYLWHDSPSYVWLVTFTCMTWLYLYCQLLHRVCVYVWRDSFMWCDMTLLYMRDVTSRMHDMTLFVMSAASKSLCVCVTWLLYVCDMTLLQMCDVTSRICVKTPSCGWHDLFTSVTWLIHRCDMTPLHVWHDTFTCVTLVTWLIHTCLTRIIHMCGMTLSYVWMHLSYRWHDCGIKGLIFAVSVLYCVAVCYSTMQRVAVSRSVLQRAAVRCSVL